MSNDAGKNERWQQTPRMQGGKQADCATICLKGWRNEMYKGPS